MTATEWPRDDNPRWLAALVTALPVALAALWVLTPAPRPTSVPPAPAAVVAWTTAPEPAPLARTP